MSVDCCSPQIDTQVWEPNPDMPEGYVRLVRTKTVREVLGEIKAAVCPPPAEWGEVLPDDCDEYLVVAFGAADLEWPEGRIVVCAVNGTSEGDYIHVDVVEDRKHIPLILGKTFAGRDAAWRFARTLADLLGA